jgi:hypothetical protein
MAYQTSVIDSFRDAGALVAIYALAVVGPAMWAESNSGSMSWVCIPVLVVVGIYTLDGILAWKQGRRAPLIVKVLVPAGILLASSLLLWAGIWDAFLRFIRST